MSQIGAIIVTYNSISCIGGCLDSLLSQTDKEFDIVIVDNNSTDDTVKLIKQKLAPDAGLICNKHNYGFGRAVNQGIEYFSGKDVIVLNSDVILRSDFISELKKAILRLPSDIGMISPKLLKLDKRCLDSTGLVLSKMRRFYDRGRGAIDLGQFDGKQDIFGPCAASAFYTRKMLEDIKIGKEYFDEDFFLLLEDFDISWRARRYGWKATFISQLVCYHQGGISRNKTALSQYYSFRNRYLLLLKNAQVSEILWVLMLVPIYEIPRFIFLLLFNNNTMRALKEIKRLLPKMLKKRKSIFSTKC